MKLCLRLRSSFAELLSVRSLHVRSLVSIQTMSVSGRQMPAFEKPLNCLVHLDDQLLVQEQFAAHTKKRPEESQTLWIQSHNELFKSVRQSLLSLFNQRYLIYPVTTDDLRSKPWLESTKLLISITRDAVDEQTFLEQSSFQQVKQYVQTGGNFCLLHVASVCSDDRHFHDQSSAFLADSFIKQLHQHLPDSFFNEFANQQPVHLPTLTAHYFVTESLFNVSHQAKMLKESLKEHQEVSIVDDQLDAQQIEQMIKNERIPIVICSSSELIDQLSFRINDYYANLKTSKLGHTVIYADVTKSTHPICESISDMDGLVVIAKQQLEGRGRGENQWISPKGSISFSFSFTIKTNSKLFKSLGFVQHLAAISLVRVIKQKCQNNDLDIKIKWPNDIYWTNKHKLGGFLTTSRFQGNHVQFFVGIGINLANAQPTTSLYNLIDELDGSINKPTAEELVAGVLTKLEELIDWFEVTPLEQVIAQYCQHWLMDGLLVQLKDGKTAQVIGIDDQGYLKVKDAATQRQFSLHPDGNRFDMIRNLSEVC